MDIEQIKSILYKPYFNIPSTYETQSQFEQTVVTPSEEYIENKTDELEKQIVTVEKKLIFVPGEMKNSTQSILDLVKFFLILVKDDYDEGQDKNEEDIIITENDPDSKWDTIFPDKHKPTQVSVQRLSKEQSLKYDYASNTVDVMTTYITELDEILTQYLCKIVTKPQSILFIDSYYNTKLDDYNNGTAHNILQSLIKSQQAKFSKMRMYNKLFNENEGLCLLKSLEYSKMSVLKQQLNMPKEEYLLFKHKQMLFAEKEKLDKKHYEFYRYLNSSLKLMEECLSLNFTEALSKYELFIIAEENKKQANAK